jgi:hypothetical protein
MTDEERDCFVYDTMKETNLSKDDFELRETQEDDEYRTEVYKGEISEEKAEKLVKSFRDDHENDYTMVTSRGFYDDDYKGFASSVFDLDSFNEFLVADAWIVSIPKQPYREAPRKRNVSKMVYDGLQRGLRLVKGVEPGDDSVLLASPFFEVLDSFKLQEDGSEGVR